MRNRHSSLADLYRERRRRLEAADQALNLCP
jgi:hypothetical protein